MTIQDWGSIGELVAALATVATLAYLAVQIRANTAALRMEANRAETQAGDLYMSAIIGSPEVSRMFNLGLADPSSLSPEDVTRFCFLFGRFLGAEAISFEEARSGYGVTDAVDWRKERLARFLDSPGGRWFWRKFAGDYAPKFRSYADQIIHDSEFEA